MTQPKKEFTARNDASSPDIRQFDGTRSAKLADEVLATDAASLGARDLEQLRKLLLDHLACCHRGAHLPWGRMMREWAHRTGGQGDAQLFADAMRTAPAIAAFVNATAAHGLELDDTHEESVSHPGAGIFAAALAYAQSEGAGGRDMLAAVAAGYEVTGRLGAATNAAEVIEMGYHPTSLFTGFGVAAAVARLVGFTPKQLRQAWGLMLSMAGGSMQFSQEQEGTTVKRLHGGLAALHGATAVDLAALGIAGPEQALDGRYGLTAIFGRRQQLDRLVEPHPDGPEIHRVSFKPYPCCRLFHSTLDALQEVTDDFAIGGEAVRRITVGGPEILVTQHMMTRPKSEMAAQYSLPYTLGAAFCFGPRSVDGFEESVLDDERILAVADRVEAVVDDEFEAAFPEHFGSWLELETGDGTVRRADVLDSLGTPARPMTPAALIEKFDTLCAPTGFAHTGEEIAERLERLDSNADVVDLIELFAAEDGSAKGRKPA